MITSLLLRRKLWVRVLVGVIVATLLVGTIVALNARPVGTAPRSIASDATVVASSTNPLFSARDAVTSGSVDLPGAGWVSGQQTIGAWIELKWPETRDLQQVILVRNSLDEPGVTSGYLTFGDLSHLFVTLSTTSRQTVIPVGPRSVDSVRFTAAQVTGGASEITISEIVVMAGDGSNSTIGDLAVAPNAATSASIDTNAPTPGSDPQALVDGDEAMGAAGTGAAWIAPDTPSAQLNWTAPQEVTSVQVVGAAGPGKAVRRGTLLFSDGSELPLGAVLSDPSRPTTVSFMPRSTTSVRLTIDETSGSGELRLAEIRVYRRGATPVRLPTAVQGVGPPEVKPPAECADGTRSSVGLVITCPGMGSTVDQDVTFTIDARAEYTSVRAAVWPGDAAAPEGPAVEVALDRTGAGQVTIPIAQMPRGPFTIDFRATGSGAPTTDVYFQLYRPLLDVGGSVATSPLADGRTLAYSEEFDRPISISRTGAGADYAAAKPVPDGAVDFGEAVFADPADYANMRVVDGQYLRMDIAPLSFAELDPQGWGRRHIGALLASSRPGGSGFSAQYGYFESRILAPAAPGTWPAFWMLPNVGVISEAPVVAEIDAVELYGHDPRTVCSSTHQHETTPDVTGITQCAQRFASEQVALAWHTYGVAIMPDVIQFYIDDVQVASAPQVLGGQAPMFFLIDLALGGGWPVSLDGVQNRAAMYVDYIRAYV